MGDAGSEGDGEEVTQTLFGYEPPVKSHSPTSIDAGLEIRPRASRLRELVYRAIAITPEGLTDAEIEYVTGLAGSTARPRRIELLREGRIRQEGTRPTPSGRSAAVWVKS